MARLARLSPRPLGAERDDARPRTDRRRRWPACRGAFICGLALLLWPALPAWAQGYPQMHVVALAQHADRAVVDPGGTFHVTIHVKITQRRERLDELILGSFEDCEIISNETVRTSLPDGTDFVERLTVQALRPGEATISPAYIDALDPARGRPMRFSSNALRVRVTGASPIETTLRSAGDVLRRLLTAAGIVASGFAVVFVLGVLFVRRRRRPAKAEPLAPPVATAVPTPAVVAAPSSLAQLAARYRAERSADALAGVRAALFMRAGVSPGATLVDALRALGEREDPLRTALLAAENAMFGPAVDRYAAGDAMLAAITALEPQRATEESWTR